MEILSRYVHGSEDSIDIDVYYVVDELPSFQECKEWCDSKKGENANLITIDNEKYTIGKVYKGTVDEVNNSLIATYNWHIQEYPMPSIFPMERDVVLKFIRSIRIILSHLSKSQFREEIKNALNGGDWATRLDTLNDINICAIDFSAINKNMSAEDIKKVIAFQIGQCLGLMDGIELYRKSEIAKQYPILKQYLYRQNNSDIYELQAMIQHLIKRMNEYMEHRIIYNGKCGFLTCIDGKYDVKFEKRIW